MWVARSGLAGGGGGWRVAVWGVPGGWPGGLRGGRLGGLRAAALQAGGLAGSVWEAGLPNLAFKWTMYLSPMKELWCERTIPHTETSQAYDSSFWKYDVTKYQSAAMMRRGRAKPPCFLASSANR